MNTDKGDFYMDKVKLGEYIAKARKDKNLTQKDVADALMISVSTISKWERGLYYPDITLLYQLSELLDITLQELFTQTKQGKEMSEWDYNQCLKELLLIVANNTVQNKKHQKRMDYLIACTVSFIVFLAGILVYQFVSHIDPVFTIVSSEYSIAATADVQIKNMDMVVYVKGNAEEEDFVNFSKDIYARWQRGELVELDTDCLNIYYFDTLEPDRNTDQSLFEMHMLNTFYFETP